MKICLAVHDGGGHFESVQHVAADLATMLGSQYEIVRFVSVPDAPATDRDAARATEAVEASDLLVGFGSLLAPLLEARQRLGSDQRCVILALGTFPRGALQIRALLPYLRRDDLFVVNCTADASLAEAIIPGARVEVVHFAIRDAIFSPMTRGARSCVRSSFGLTPKSELLLYAGRISVEKNVHSVLRVFASIWRQLSDPYLFLAGPFVDAPFHELGSVPVNYARALERCVSKLAIPPERVRHLGTLRCEHLREAYCAADVLINLTLHHDENFGFGQLEAMACGTPVVGTAWGGLRDTIRRGVTGYDVTAVVTPLGVKVDWWDAANAVYDIVTSPPDERWRIAQDDIPLTGYSRAVVAKRLASVMERVVASPPARAPLSASPFARELWDVCTDPQRPFARFEIGTRSFELYRELVAHYAGGTPPNIRDLSSDCAEMTLIMPAPVAVSRRDRIDVNDPLFPTRVQMPPDLIEDVRRILNIFAREPVVTVARLRAERSLGTTADRALTWMLQEGLALVSRRTRPRLSADSAGPAGGEPIFAIRSVDWRSSDFLAVKD